MNYATRTIDFNHFTGRANTSIKHSREEKKLRKIKQSKPKQKKPFQGDITNNKGNKIFR